MNWLRRNPDLIRILRLVKYEAEGLFAHVLGKLSLKQRRKLSELAKQRHLKLNFASGVVPRARWVNVDVIAQADIRMDLRRRIPLPDNCVQHIFCEHFCDHLQFPIAIGNFLKESFRVLEPGGRVRLVMHDMEGLAKAYLNRDQRYFTESGITLSTMAESVNLLFRFNDFHQFLYDFETFKMLLERAGFISIEKCSYRESRAGPELALDHDAPGRELMSMYIEAVKPESLTT
ncbi:hypothetical protein BQ8794_50228 [Mesorhizobium prunaredense]|uniref:Methyltransferase type 11 domain-containing protein n=1 Tax=Mesorhizobium prunaredense TaxID=1631249 RepID=A0A1R3VE35_9HYPH|nr:methyltransferase domain-containing protein [Mesorhizobium prunaredense]SIT58126.1 hypothetical protein BQ8794_50228 [Mesorhizobium prunaredense]